MDILSTCLGLTPQAAGRRGKLATIANLELTEVHPGTKAGGAPGTPPDFTAWRWSSRSDLVA